MTNLYAIILAGGSGSRLWPLSREMHPKQLMKLNDESTLFQSTFIRLINNIDDRNIMTITNVKNEPVVRQQLKELQEKFCRTTSYEIITEPIAKNTAPAIALGTKYITEKLNWREEEPIILVVPSDQLVLDEKSFAKFMEEGLKLAEAGYIVSFGIKPYKEDSGVGYIKVQKNKKISNISPISYKVSAFKEKPENEEVEEFIKSDKYFWNSGILMFKQSVMMAEMKKHSSEIYKIIEKSNLSKNIPSVEYQIFKDMPEISIEYAILEKTKKLAMIPLNCYWYDLGSWEALYEVADKDENNNYLTGNAIDLNSKNSMVYSTSKLTATIALENTIVVETEDAILVCDKSRVNDVKEIYNKLKDKNDLAHAVHKTVYRPWGYYTVLQEGEGFLTKSITVNPEGKLSLQKHKHRSEHWIVLEGTATIIKGDVTVELKESESIDIEKEEIHSLQNQTKEPLTIIEVQKGNILDENDIERLEDIYGRV